MRIAVTTSDGKKVDQHFGKATTFTIYDVNDGNLKMVDLRVVDSYCQCENGEPVDPGHQFSPDRFTKVKETISDCDKLFTFQIGEKPKEQLERIGIDVKVCGCAVGHIPECRGNCK